jgi:Arc/MetJ-type ribon-helix-helix transcriptional regulator
MTIEIHEPELERLVQQEIRSGRYQNVDELLTEAIRALREKSTGGTGFFSLTPHRTREEAGAHIREARKGTRLPEGMTIRDLIDKGRA